MFRVENGGKLVINNVVINGNGNNINAKAPAIWMNGGTLQIENATIKDCINKQTSSNSTDCRGGAIRFGTEGYTRTVSGSIVNTTIEGCQAANGSAIMLANLCEGTIVVSDSIIKGCSSNASDWGGTIRTQGNFNGKLIIEGCTIKENYSSKNGGGVYWNACGTKASLTIRRTEANPTIIKDNTAGVQGGGLHLGGQEITVEDTQVIGNSAPDGGGFSVTPYEDGTNSGSGCSITLGNNAIIEGNRATNRGGGVYMRIYSADPASGKEFAITVNDGAVIRNNEAAKGGAFAVIQESGTKKYHADINVNGGIISGNEATDNGGAFYISRNYGKEFSNYKLNVDITGGTIQKNITTGNGGAIYLTDTASSAKVTVTGGNIGSEGYANEATNGGAVYVSGGNFIMSNGTITYNKANSNGGAVYVTGGDIDMSGGTFEQNTAENGGAVYVAGGNMMVYHGILNNNSAACGGAVYMAGNESTKFTIQSGQMNGNTASDDGGAIYATKGILEIGLKDCNGTAEHDSKHTALGAGRYHPLINDNEAQDTGGGIAVADEGIVHFYCGNATGNEALYKGVGKNVFMQGGEIFLYEGANIGVPRDPDLVIIGGTLHNMDANKDYITLKYYDGNENIEGDVFTGYAEVNEEMNLPDGEYFWDAETGYRFFGWTPRGTESTEQFVRDKDQYKASGIPVEIIDAAQNSYGEDQGTYDGTADNIMNLYALWAPIISTITYVDGMTNNVITDPVNPPTYSINENDYTLMISQIEKPGYKIAGWYIYQNEDQNANWGYEPVYKDDSSKDYSNLDLEGMKSNGQYIPVTASGTIELLVESMTFGDITLIANYEPQYSSMEITKLYPAGADYSIDENQSFLFNIEGKPDNKELGYIDMTVTVQGDGSCLISELPVGTYTVTEITDWSWRYDLESVALRNQGINSNAVNNGVKIVVNDASVRYMVDFTNKREKIYWLSGDSHKMNIYKTPIEFWSPEVIGNN